MDRQTLRDWVHRFNKAGPDGLMDACNGGPVPRLSSAQKAELPTIVETGPDPVVDGIVRWRRVDLQKLIKARLRRRLPRALRRNAAEGTVRISVCGRA